MQSNLITLNSTLIRALTDSYGEEKEICPRKVFELNIKKEIKSYQTPAMKNGVYFETMLLGKGVYGSTVTDLPKTTKGLDTAEQKSIDYQVVHAKSIAEERGMMIAPENTQVTIYKKVKDNIHAFGNLDWFPVMMKIPDRETGELVPTLTLIDVKLPKNVENDYGEYAWGKPQFMDHVQADLYYQLVRDIDFDLNDRLNPSNTLRKVVTPKIKEMLDNREHKFFYWVFGYPSFNQDVLNEQFVEIEREVTDINVMELKERIRKVIAIVEMLEEEGWPVNPLRSLCKECTVSKLRGGYCKDYCLTVKI